MKHAAKIRKKVTPAALADAEKFLLPTYKRQPLVFTRGRGTYVFDSNGKRYLDFLGGIAVNGLGHAHPNIVKVIRRESARAIHLSNLFHNEFQGPLAKKLAEISGMDRVFFSNSGAEAIEGCLKLARLYSRPADAPITFANPRHRILALEHSFHGRTFGAVSITATEKYRLPFAPLVPGVEFVKFNNIADLESKFDKNVCAVILETIQGEGGIHPVSEAFWNRARALTRQHDALLIADEIQCGLGRTGRYFAYQKFSSKPDLVAVAKPLAAGLPLGAILASEAIAARVSPGVHGTTFGGGPMICAVALEFLKVLDKTKVLANAAARGTELRAGIEKLAAKFPFIKEVRGEGLMIGVELAVDGSPFVAEAMNRGLLINCTHEFTLRLLPAFIITAKQVKEFLQIFEEVLGHVSKSMAATETARLAAHTAAR
ncbi:MAG: aspartate aminotransferase family protein [Acidobacteria bacterium]|nr:aspartate aminotransferase family protein [Acidobacteriota bacterium]MBS1864453.1 aspartate aminotransferase family protein [Acidobacteriota bacterium]